MSSQSITHAFLQFTDSDERDKYIRSANMLEKELRGRIIRMSPAMDAEERKKPGYIKYCTHTRHNIQLVQISMNRVTRHESVDGQVVIRTCANGSLKYHKYQDIEAEVAETFRSCIRSKHKKMKEGPNQRKGRSRGAAAKREEKEAENESKDSCCSCTEKKNSVRQTIEEKDVTPRGATKECEVAELE